MKRIIILGVILVTSVSAALFFFHPVSAKEIVERSTKKFEMLDNFHIIYTFYLNNKKWGKVNIVYQRPIGKMELYNYVDGNLQLFKTIYIISNESEKKTYMVECYERDKECIGYPYEQSSFQTTMGEINFSKLEFADVREMVSYFRKLLEATETKITLEYKGSKYISERSCDLVRFKFLEKNYTIDICYDKEFGIPLQYKEIIFDEWFGEISTEMRCVFFSHKIPFNIFLPKDIKWYSEKPSSPFLIVQTAATIYTPPKIEKISCSEKEIVIRVLGGDETYYLSFLQQINTTPHNFGSSIVLHGLPDMVIEPNSEKIIRINFSQMEDWRIMDETVVRVSYSNFQKKLLPHKFVKGNVLKFYFCKSSYFNDCIENFGYELFGITLDKPYLLPKVVDHDEEIIC